MNNNRFCTQEWHNKGLVTHLCLYEDCKLKNQQCCRLCITQGIHQHGKSDNEHIRLRQQIQNNHQMLPQLDQQDDQSSNVKSIDFKNRKYDLKQIDHGGKYYVATISNDEKYLAYGGDKIFKIFDLKEDKIIKQIKSEGTLKSCQFTSDSSYLFVAYVADQSLIIGYDVKMNFKKAFQYYIQAQQTNDIIIIQNQYLMTSGDNKIVKIDIKRKKYLFKLQNDEWITAMDYDQNNNFLINGSYDDSLKLWHCRYLKNIINKQEAHIFEICQVQLINNIQNVLSLDYHGNLYKWKIDLIENQLIQLEQYQSYKHIWSFQQINQNQNLLLICQYCINILDDTGKLIYNIDHQIEFYEDIFDQFRYQIRQLDNARYVIIGSKRQIILALALNCN